MSASGELSINALIRQCWKQANLDDGLPHRMDNRTAKVLSLLARCRRGELGARRHDCPDCGSSTVSINACHDRHCPLCAKQSRFVWEKQVMQWSLDCDYLHLVVTLPHEFNPLVAANPGPLLRLLQVCARDAVLWLAKQHGIDDPGLILVLHTWGQRLNHHFHVHTVMTAGGLRSPTVADPATVQKTAVADPATVQPSQSEEWIMIDQDLLASQHALLADKFKKLYLRRLRRLLSKQLQPEPTALLAEGSNDSTASTTPKFERNGASRTVLHSRSCDTLDQPSYTRTGVLAHNRSNSNSSTDPSTSSLTPHPSSLLRYPLEHPDQQSIEKMLSVVEAKHWVADIGVTPQEFRNRGLRKNSIRYVGAYVAGSAIGDGRLVSQTEDRVTFRIFDYRSDQYTNLEMSKIEFVQAYARHILPSGLRRVRYVGLFRPFGRTTRLDKCRELIHQALAVANPKAKQQAATSDEEDQQDENELKMGVFCSKCQAKMEVTGDFEGPVTCWMLNVSMLVVAWLRSWTGHRSDSSSRSLTGHGSDSSSSCSLTGHGSDSCSRNEAGHRSEASHSDHNNSCTLPSESRASAFHSPLGESSLGEERVLPPKDKTEPWRDQLRRVFDAQSIASALKAVVDRLQEEAWNREHGRSIELSRCAGVTPGDLFYNEAHHQFLLILIAQQIQQQQASEDELAQRLSLSNHTTRGPPTSNFELHTSNFGCGLPEVQS